MSGPATLTWIARHELRLFWRDTVSMLTAGKRSRETAVAVVALAAALVAHLVAYAVIAPSFATGPGADKPTLVLITATAALSWALMLSQTIETVTRGFYARADLDLILSSPTSARRVFAVRMAAIALSSMALTTCLAGPYINVLALRGGPRWLAGYGVLAAVAALATALAIVVTVTLFRAVGPRLTRAVSQIVSAVVAAAFVVGVQAAAILSTGSFSRLALFRSKDFIALAPDPSSPAWLLARAVMGDAGSLLVVMAAGFGALGAVIAIFSGSFAHRVVVVSGVADRTARRPLRPRAFRTGSTRQALLRKELTLMRRDPWLLSQTLMQIFYLLPPILVLWLHFDDGGGALLVLMPVLVMAAGQLAGGLAWISVSGEDAPDLVASAPVLPRAVIRAKIEAVLGSVVVIVAPLLAALAVAEPAFAVVAALGIVASAASGTMIQFWFRSQARRSRLRRRQIPSRIATMAEALSSILWAGTAALATVSAWLAAVPAVGALLVLGGMRVVRPRQESAA